MPDDRLDRAEVGGGGVLTAQFAQHRELDGVADGGSGAVRLQVTHRARGQARVAVGPAQGPELAARPGVHAALHGPVVGRAHAADHRVHAVAGRLGVGQGPQHQHPGALPQDETVGLRAEGQAPAAAREGAYPAQPHQQVRGEDQLGATGDRDAGAARAQRVDRVGDGHEATGTRGVQCVALTVQVEDRADRVRSHVEEESGHGRAVQPVDGAYGLLPAGVRRPGSELSACQLAHPYPHGAELAVAALGEGRDHRGLLAVEALGLPPRVLERLTGQVDQQPVLGVHRGGPARRYAVVRRVEVAHVRQQRHGVGVDRRGVAEVAGEEGVAAPARVRHGGELRPRGREEPPVLVQVPGPREPAGHSHDGYRLVLVPLPRDLRPCCGVHRGVGSARHQSRVALTCASTGVARAAKAAS